MGFCCLYRRHAYFFAQPSAQAQTVSKKVTTQTVSTEEASAPSKDSQNGTNTTEAKVFVEGTSDDVTKTSVQVKK